MTQEALSQTQEPQIAFNSKVIGYVAPQRKWIGLTKQQFSECVDGLEDLEDCWIALEAKLKEKNT